MALDQVNYAAMRFMPSRYLYFHGFEYGQPSKYEFESVTHMGERPVPENDAFWFIPDSAKDIQIVFSFYGMAGIADFRIDEDETWNAVLGGLAPITDSALIQQISIDMARCPWRYRLEDNSSAYVLLKEAHTSDHKHYLVINSSRTIAWYYSFSADFPSEVEQICTLQNQD
ncbi:MAG: hypothetical protein IPH06_05045 [Alphaproteobacteria bacterium]|nr:hypothetical protein [Alphaproteobacteria bacterium]QQS57390.1 MAG: hypothetical protein IPN28_00805 [Alphaproteobacteria bacterium]